LYLRIGEKAFNKERLFNEICELLILFSPRLDSLSSYSVQWMYMKKTKILKSKSKKNFCRHDYKNAVQVGKIDYMCPLCGKLLDPCEWFFMNSFEFVDVDSFDEDNSQKL